MKYLVPIVVVGLLFLAVFAGIKYKNSKSQNTDSTTEQVTGNPDDAANSITKSGEDEAGSSSAEDDEAMEVNSDVDEVSAVGKVYDDNEF